MVRALTRVPDYESGTLLTQFHAQLSTLPAVRREVGQSGDTRADRTVDPVVAGSSPGVLVSPASENPGVGGSIPPLTTGKLPLEREARK